MNSHKRYERQMILPEIGESGQDALANTSVLCVGAGGLGAPALLYLAAAGIGRIGIADFDQVEQSNLQRQVLYRTDQIGTSKTTAAKAQLEAFNPDIQINTYPDGLTSKNTPALFKEYDIILDGTDNFETKYLINDAGVKFGKPVIFGALNKFEGQVSVFDAQKGPCYRCLHPEKPKEHIQNCAEAGVIGAVAGITGLTQAMQVIMLATGHESFEPLIGKLWVMNTKTMESKLLDIPKDPACPVCSIKKEDIKLNHSTTPCAADIAELSIEDLDQHPEALLIDVREQEEWDQGYIDGAELIALSKLLSGHIPDLPQDQNIILYCRSGQRSLQAAHILKAKGYDKVMNLTGGYMAWLQKAA